MNIFHEVQNNMQFTIILSNLSRVARRLPKGMIVAFASRSPIVLVALKSGVTHELGAMYDFPTAHDPPKDTSSEPSDKESDENIDQD